MKVARLATATNVLVVVLSGRVLAQVDVPRPLPPPPRATSAQQRSSDHDGYVYISSAWGDEPSGRPYTTTVDETPRAGIVPNANDPAYDERDSGTGSYWSGYPWYGYDRPNAWTLPQPWFLEARGLRLGGWIQQGLSAVANNPVDRYNGVVTFNDRDGEYQMNQLWFYLDRPCDTGGYGWDLGGHIDFVYGTDARFTQADDGLENNWNQTQRFYQAALPQFYLDVGYNDWTVRIGHFFSILGYEGVAAPDNFFYSRPYTQQYGEPFTHTGILFTREAGDRWSFTAGLHRGNDQFDDTDGLNALNFLGGMTWTDPEEVLSLTFGVSATEQGPNLTETIYSLVASCDVTERFTYVIQHDYGVTSNTLQNVGAEWYGLNQYLLYSINDLWEAGVRIEWFRDDDGIRVGRPEVPTLTGPFVGDFFEVTAGLNWKPTANITVRPEVRWDWFNRDVAGVPGPYDAGGKDEQFLFSCDLIMTY